MNNAAKVGLFTLIILLILGFFILKIEDIAVDRGSGTKKVDVLFDSVAGLEEKSAVRVAGVRVGKVEKINLTPEGKARVTLEVDRDVQLHRGASANVANLGLLGEKYVELEPGSPSAPVLAEGQPVTLRGGQPASFDEVTNQISSIAEDVKAITSALRKSMGGPEGEKRVEEIVDNVHQITAQVRLLIEANRGNINATAENMRIITENLRQEIPKIAATIDRVAGSIGGTVGENREDLRAIVENLKTLSADLKVTATNLNSITDQVKSGEGTVGKLIYSDEAHDRLTGALTSVESGVNELKTTLGRANRITLDLGIKSDYYAGRDDDPNESFEGGGRTAVMLNLLPDPDKNRFYRVELSDDPRGSRKDKIITTTTSVDGGPATTTTTRQIKLERDFLLSAQAGWQLDDLALRIGLFDSAGGVGADYRFNDRLTVTGEVFDFGKKRDDNPHLRLFGEYVLRSESSRLPKLFVSTGVDNPLNDTAFTIGGGIRWRDDDLKYLLGSIPMGK